MALFAIEVQDGNIDGPYTESRALAYAKEANRQRARRRRAGTGQTRPRITAVTDRWRRREMSNVSSHRHSGGEEVWLIPIGIVLAVGVVLYWAGRLAAVIAGTTCTATSSRSSPRFAHLGNPSAAWHANVGPPAVYWFLQLLGLVVLAAAASRSLVVCPRDRPQRHPHESGPRRRTRRRARARAARSAKRRRRTGAASGARRRCARRLRNRGRRTSAWRSARHAGCKCWATVEDSILVFGPPRSGKGLHLVIPAILNYPGAVVTTSTRPDSLPITLRARSSDDRPVGVFDPQGLAAGVPSALRWSPIRGCERPQTAMIRAAGLAASSDKGLDREQRQLLGAANPDRDPLPAARRRDRGQTAGRRCTNGR